MHHTHVPAKTQHLQSRHQEPQERENNKVRAKNSAETLLPLHRPTSLLQARNIPTTTPDTQMCDPRRGTTSYNYKALLKLYNGITLHMLFQLKPLIKGTILYSTGATPTPIVKFKIKPCNPTASVRH